MTETTELEVPDTLHIEDHDRERESPEQQGEDTQERQRSPRDAMMDEIARRRAEAISRELQYGEELADEARGTAGLEPLPHAKDAPEEPPAEPAREAQAPAPKAAQPPLRTVTIDGRQFQVTEDQYAELATMGVRTNFAMQQYQAEQQRQAAAAQQARQQHAPQPAQTLAPDEAEQLAERLLYGGKEDVAKTLQEYSDKLVAQTRAQQMQAAQQATARAQQALQLENDLRTIAQEYPEIRDDQILGELAAVQLTHVAREDQALGRQRTNLETIREACNRVMKAIAQPRTGTSSSPQAQAADRAMALERKRAAPKQPIGIDRRAAETATPRAKTGSQIVAEMRRARFQMPMN